MKFLSAAALLVLMFALVVVTLYVKPTGAQFYPDPGDGGGSGGGGSYCYSCALVSGGLACVEGSHGDSCKVWTENGKIKCKTSGSCGQNFTVWP